MFQQECFATPNSRIESLLRAGGFAHLVSWRDGAMTVTSLPLIYRAATHSLLGHVARPNDQWDCGSSNDSVAIIACGDAYVSPQFYPSKREHHRVVPTWNYETMYVYGRIQAHDDPNWILEHLTELTDEHEGRRANPWRISDAPSEYINSQLRGIVGVELHISRIVGKSKLSQNKSDEDRAGVVRSLALGSPHEQAVAAAVNAPEIGVPSESATNFRTPAGCPPLAYDPCEP